MTNCQKYGNQKGIFYYQSKDPYRYPCQNLAGPQSCLPLTVYTGTGNARRSTLQVLILAYNYNIIAWLTSINKVIIQTDPDATGQGTKRQVGNMLLHLYFLQHEHPYHLRYLSKKDLKDFNNKRKKVPVPVF
jgi:hypothetical protein